MNHDLDLTKAESKKLHYFDILKKVKTVKFITIFYILFSVSNEIKSLDDRLGKINEKHTSDEFTKILKKIDEKIEMSKEILKKYIEILMERK